MRKLRLLLLAISGLAALPVPARAQALADSGDSSGPVSGITADHPDLLYTRPTEKTRLRNYFFDTFGPYPIVISAIAAGINQAENTPPEWKQDSAGYGKRFGSNFGIAAVTTTTRYALSRAFREDALYYRCTCKGLFPRLGHAVIFFLHSTPRRRWPGCLFISRCRRSVCREHDCRLRLVPGAIRCQGCLPHG